MCQLLRASPRPNSTHCFSLSLSSPISTKHKPKTNTLGVSILGFLEGKQLAQVSSNLAEALLHHLQVMKPQGYCRMERWQQRGTQCFPSLHSSHGQLLLVL